MQAKIINDDKVKRIAQNQHQNVTQGIVIDVKQAADGTWAVVAHLTSGNAHDFFTTQEEALAFAQDFYGRAKIRVAGQAPATTPEACLGYHTSEHSCDCPDFVNRGGSWIDEFGTASCKHILHVQQHGLAPAVAEQAAAKLFARFA